jgi:hypothetical protein
MLLYQAYLFQPAPPPGTCKRDVVEGAIGDGEIENWEDEDEEE